MAKLALYTLFALLSGFPLSSALQVTPNSPCSSVCRDSLDLDVSDPNSSTTKNSDITCGDADYSSPAGTKFKSCMTCLQTSTFSQGSESDTMWFLYNLRYTAAYCVFGYPNATKSTPCTTSTACGQLQDSIQHGLQDPSGTDAFSYCSAGDGAAMDFSHFDTCIPCISAEGANEYLANYFLALEAGCRQQPAPGTLLGLSDTVFSDTRIEIVDPASLDEDDEKSGPAVPVIVGIVVGVVAFLLIVAGITFVCLRRRRNKRVRASAEADYYAQFNNRHHSSMSFQCQTHMASPRLWPGAEEGLSTPVAETPDVQTHRSSIWKPPYPHEEEQDTTTTIATATTAHIAHHKTPAMPLHITTTVPPTPPPQAYTSPSSAERVYHSPSDFRSPLSAESVRSTSALLPALKPYVPAEHGVHTAAAAAASPTTTITTSPATTAPGTGMTPLLRNHAWPLPSDTTPPPRQGHNRENARRPIIKLDSAVPAMTTTPPPPPPQLKTSRSSGLLAAGGGRKSPMRVTGSPVESWEIQTAFAAPPGGRR
ncbi:hypothetical protein F5144DRAFT_568835 [Chaetomium tenue]|uniref:Uncharacterized protein n=1 Tax=Chaetomium tenue TaxID=1854479 RepID=A0ACB7PET1_9PEZI|nr:hypothetical protein F5144DRAFT_568835 [Chaetomium globosum]